MSLERTIPGMAVDAIKSRQFRQAVIIVDFYKAHNALPPVIVIHLGTNGAITNDVFDQIMRTIGPGHPVYFLTARVPGSGRPRSTRPSTRDRRVGTTPTSSNGAASRAATTTGSSPTGSTSAHPVRLRTPVS